MIDRPKLRLAVALVAAAVTIVGAVPRVLLAAGAVPEALRPFVWSDSLFVYLRGLSGHRLPYVDGPFEYPPLVAAASAVLSITSQSALAFVASWAILQGTVAAVAAWLLTSAAPPRRVLARFALSPQLLLLGSLNFDLLAVAFLTAALLAAGRDRNGRAAGLIAFGTLSKLFPIVAAPIVIARARDKVRVVLILGGMVAAGYAAASLAGPTGGSGPGYYLVGIGANLDSPWGLVTAALRAFGVANATVIVTTLSLVGFALTYALGVLPLARAREATVPMGLAVVGLLLWSRLYSPQYSLWLLPLFVLLPLGTRLFALLIAGDLIVFFTVFPLTLVLRSEVDITATLLLGALAAGVFLRLAALVGVWRALRGLGAVA